MIPLRQLKMDHKTISTKSIQKATFKASICIHPASSTPKLLVASVAKGTGWTKAERPNPPLREAVELTSKTSQKQKENHDMILCWKPT